MKRVISVLLSCVMVLTAAGCRDGEEVMAELPEGGVNLEVVTTFAGNDGNADSFKEHCRKWEEATGNTVWDKSAISDNTFKLRVMTDFETGSEPDVLFFFTGADANNFIKAGKVVSLLEVRKAYPGYGSNMDGSKMQASLVDRQVYALPVTGYWEGLFVNTTVLKAAGVEVPGADYTWEQFYADCDKIKQAGYTPIAAALGDIPNYWWEFAIFNHTGPARHLLIPDSVQDEIGKAWVAGLEDIKQLYQNGYFPANTNAVRDDEILNMFVDGKAAFLVDGSWRINGIVQGCQTDPDDPATLDEKKLDQFTVTYVPSHDRRKATDVIGGVSMGYYITQKAWNNPEKREAAVNFISYMTSDEVVLGFSKHTNHILKNKAEMDDTDLNSLQKKAIKMLKGVTSMTGALQDIFYGECRTSTFTGLPEIITGLKEPGKAVEEGLYIFKNTR